MVWKGDGRRRLARSLITLIDQVDAQWPNRDRTSDGSIGDAAHAARASDHNPNSVGVVTALDLDRDIASGFNARKLAEALVASRDPRIKYIISNAQIISSKVSPWQWRPYTGVNAHREHIHISVDSNPALYDDPRPWAINAAAPKPGLHEDIVATVFGGPSDSMSGSVTAYGSLVTSSWWDRPGVALPARFSERPLPQVRVTHNGKSVVCPVIDVGPWNTKDPYWLNGSRPQAESGVDMTGRRTNLAGIDLTPAAANAIGLKGKGMVDWEFIQENTVPDEQTTPQPGPTLTVNNELLAQALGQLLLPLLVSVLTQGKGFQLPPAALPPPATAPQPAPAPAPAPTGSVITQSGTQLGTILGIATLALQLFGILPPSMGEAATAAGQGISFLAGAAPVAGATGLFGTIGTILGRLFGGK